MVDPKKPSTLTVRKALYEAMAEEMRRDSRVFLMGEEVGEYQGAYKISQGLLEEFGPKRIVDTPISEYGFSGIGVGAALAGLLPIVEFMSFNFAMQAIDHILNSAAKTRYMSGGSLSCPIVFRGPNGAAARVGAQHSQCYGSWYAHCPGLQVVAPYDSASSKGLLKAAIRNPNPVIFLENEMLYGRSFEVSPDSPEVWDLEKALVRRVGTDVTLVGFSLMVDLCLQAAEILAAEHGIQAEVIDLVSLRPLDTPTILRSVQKTNRIVVVEEGWPVCGIASEIMAQMVEQGFDALDAPPARVTGADVPLAYAKGLEALSLPKVPQIIKAALGVCYRG